ncbi:MAG: hypothetical protein RSD35_10530 [Oscillospiraceae bacterium]
MLSNKTQKIINAVLLVAVLLTTMLSWFGGARDVQEIRGYIVLMSPFTIMFMLVVVASFLVKGVNMGHILRIIGFSGIIIMEIFYFFTWYLQTINHDFSISMCFNMTYPEFYFSLIIACIPLILNVIFLVQKNCIRQSE